MRFHKTMPIIKKIIAQTCILCVTVLTYSFILSSFVLAGNNTNRTIKVAIIPFDEVYEENEECGKLELGIISDKLATYLKRSKTIGIETVKLSDSTINEILPNYKLKLPKTPEDAELDSLINALNKKDSPYSYLILGQIKVAGTRRNIVAVECHTINCQTGKIEFTSKAHQQCKPEFEDVLARELQNQFEVNLAKKIRIGILDFKMTYCDTTKRRPHLEKAIPTMLGTGLSISEAIMLIEIKEIDQILKLIHADTATTSTGIYNKHTALEIGKLINVNYLIMGEYWYHDGEFRIDSRCVNIETGEIILSEGITIRNFNVELFSDRISELAIKIRKRIEEKSSRTLSVVCLPPYPYNRSNKLRASNIRKTISSKLRQAEDLRIKDDVAKINSYISRAENRRKIFTDLKVNNLLIIEFENYNDQQYSLSADAFNIDDPTESYFNTTCRKRSNEVDALVDSVVFKFLGSSGSSDESLKKKIMDIEVPTYLYRYTFGFKIGNIKRIDKEVFFKDGIGEYVELFINLNFKSKIKLELITGFDFGKTKKRSTGNKTWIYSVQSGILAKYNLNESKTINPYVGLGGIAFFLSRANEIDNDELGYHLREAGDLKPGLITLVGLEFTLQNLPLSFYLEPRYTLGMKASEFSVKGLQFPGGWLGGLYIIGGMGFNINF